jgi:hypothetical protein
MALCLLPAALSVCTAWDPTGIQELRRNSIGLYYGPYYSIMHDTLQYAHTYGALSSTNLFGFQACWLSGVLQVQGDAVTSSSKRAVG